ncbi:MAG: T9SS type A sorting domain-containing protein [Candidatus Eisenbacteria bacterium]|nr:T9SS type A sorting domain-containing protein [Candidatus Eisenbacteria bacterium]
MRSIACPLAGLLLAATLVPVTARPSPAPVTPTFELKWGSPYELGSVTNVAVDALGNVYLDEGGILKYDRMGNRLASWNIISRCIALDPAGNLIAVNYDGDRVRKYSGSGALLLEWGASGSGNGQFNGPLGAAVDRAGNVYVVDSNNARVQKFSSGGVYLSQFGSIANLWWPSEVEIDPDGNVVVFDPGFYTNAKVVRFAPSGAYLASWPLPAGDFTDGGFGLDAMGNVYVADHDGSRVLKYAADGTLLTQWGSFGYGDGQFNAPSDVACDAAGNLYVTDYDARRVQKFSGAGAPVAEGAPLPVLTIGAFGGGAGQMNGPWGVGTDDAGNVYVADTQNNRVQKFSATGAYLTQWGAFGTGNGQFDGPRSVCADHLGNVFVVDGNNNRIQRFTRNGAYLGQWGTPGNGDGQFDSPAGIACDAANYVYVADYSNSRIQKFTTLGAFALKWGSPGFGNGQFNGPYGVAVSASGRVFVVDQMNNRIQQFTDYGSFLGAWTTAGTPAGSLARPASVTADAIGNVYVADYANHRIVRFSSGGTPLAWWGGFGAGGGQLNAPIGISADAAGNVYIADTNNSRVVKYAMPASVALVSDVGNDQGRQAQIRFLRSTADAPGSGLTITGYEIYRRNDPLPGPAARATGAGSAAAPASAQLAGWTWVATVPAHGESEYNVVIPTLADATNTALEYSAFMVRAASADPYSFLDSAPGQGYTMDNLPPPAPAPFTASFSGGATNLHWGVSPAADFATFRLHRGATPDFVPTPGNRIAATADTGFADTGAPGGYYKLTAVDRNGRQSPFAVVGPGQTTDVDDPGAPGLEFALRGSRPNPARGGRLNVEFALPSAAPAVLELMDLAGRQVSRTPVGALGAGRHVVDLSRGGAVPAGIYFLRLRQGDLEATRRTVVLD